MSDLFLRPWTIKKAMPFNADVHRRLPKLQGALFAVSVRNTAGVVGCAIVAHAVGQWDPTEVTLAVARVAVLPGFPNACSMLYGACSRMVKASGADNLVTYTHLDELGTSLKASNWVDGDLTAGGEHDRETRKRGPAVDALPKRRWWAPWSLRAKAIIGEQKFLAAAAKDCRNCPSCGDSPCGACQQGGVCDEMPCRCWDDRDDLFDNPQSSDDLDAEGESP